MDIQYGSSSSAYNRLHDVDCSSGDLSSAPTGPSGPPGSSRRELNAFLLRDYAFIRRRPIAGRSAKRSIASTMVRQLANSAQSSGGGSGGGGGRSGGAHANGNHHNNAAAGGPAGGAGGGVNENKSVDFLYYSDSDSDGDEESDVGIANSLAYRVSVNFTDCLAGREMGLGGRRFAPCRLTSEYGTRHMLSNAMMKEYPVVLPHMNKVFCSKWLSHRQVVFGTKCDKLMVYDVNTRHMDQIPSLQSSENSFPSGSDCGIHAIEINPSRTLLATGAKNASDVAIYRLPTLDPILVGEGAHSDWIFDMTWIDDQFVVSGSRDGSVALWRVTDEMLEEVTRAEIPSYLFSRPLMKKQCKQADRVRSLCYNHQRQEIAVISLNGYIHCWNATRFKQVMSKKLPHNMENVCLSTDEEANMYAVGSKGSTDLLDARTLQAVKKIPSRNSGCGIRSVSFKGNILTIGTGIGIMLFWDLRAQKFLESTMNSNRAVSLKASKGWLQRDDLFLQNLDGIQQQKYSPAIYTHCYDESGTRLFAAGGPLQCGLKGNYIAIFQ